MIKSRTLFIVGAGASAEVGLPVGNELKEKISSKMNIRFESGKLVSGCPQITTALRNYDRNNENFGLGPYITTAQRMRSAMPQAYSIDHFIDAHRDDKKIELCGKLGIVRCITESEFRSNIYCNDNSQKKIKYENLEGTWFQKFMQMLTEGIDRSKIENIFQNVSFINFNYDRCIEHFLIHSLENYYGIDRNSLQTLLRNLKILHPYGVVGHLPWQEGNGHSIGFGETETDLLNSVSKIKTFTEKFEDKNALSAIHEEMVNAETIVFLGFAFHQQNMMLMRPNTESQTKRVFATAKAISKSDCEIVRMQIRDLLNIDPGKVNIELRRDLSCADLFQEYWRSLSY